MKANTSMDLIHKYIKGECTAEEKADVDAWYDSFENEPDPFVTLSEADQQALRALMLLRIKENIVSYDMKQEKADSGFSYRSLLYFISGAAALLFLTLYITFSGQKNSLPETVDIPKTLSDNITITNTSRSLRKLTLPDRSTVWLSPQSQLNYPREFQASIREVKMNGEAFFEITKNPKRPFIIHSGEVVTRVWGTSFRIRAYQDKQVEVSVVTGKVSVSVPDNKRSEAILLPHEKVTYIKDNHLLDKGVEPEISQMTIWQKATISFDDVPVQDVIAILNKKFNVQISTENTDLKKYLLKADFTDQSLPDILEMLRKSLNIVSEIKNDQEIVLKKE